MIELDAGHAAKFDGFAGNDDGEGGADAEGAFNDIDTEEDRVFAVEDAVGFEDAGEDRLVSVRKTFLGANVLVVYVSTGRSGEGGREGRTSWYAVNMSNKW